MKTMYEIMEGVDRYWLFNTCTNSTSFDGLINDIISKYPHLTRYEARAIAAYTLRFTQIYLATEKVFLEKDETQTKEEASKKVAKIINAQCLTQYPL